MEEKEVKEVVKHTLREEGYPINGDEEPHEIRRDFVWMRQWRKRLETWERYVGRAVIFTLVGALLTAVGVGIKMKLFP